MARRLKRQKVGQIKKSRASNSERVSLPGQDDLFGYMRGKFKIVGDIESLTWPCKDEPAKKNRRKKKR